MGIYLEIHIFFNVSPSLLSHTSTWEKIVHSKTEQQSTSDFLNYFLRSSLSNETEYHTDTLEA